MAKVKTTAKHSKRGLLNMFQTIHKNPKILFSKSTLLSKAGMLGFVVLFAGIGAITLLFSHAATPPVVSGYPTIPPAQICGNASILGGGPITQPAGSVKVPAGDILTQGINMSQANTTYWFETGPHTIGTGANGQIIPGAGSTFIGAPGAVLDGKKVNSYAFTAQATGVTIKYLTIQNFVGVAQEGVVNHDAGPGWTVSYNTIQNNGGAGLFMGTNNVASYNCLKDNAQYGFSLYRPAIQSDSAIKNVTLDHNEIVGNNAADLEWNHDPTTGARTTLTNCGCTGGGKFWDVNGARVTNNYVHDNKSVALWADTDNIDFLFEGNYIDHNDGEGIFYEISYNATIRNNTFKRNAWVKGAQDQGSPGSAIYLSESGGDSRLSTAITGSSTLDIHDNLLEDNFSGISTYENSNRFCDSKGNTSTAYCTPFVTPTFIAENPPGLPYNYFTPYSDTHPCYTQVANEPYRSNCRWNVQNISVHNNQFNFTAANVPCVGTLCGVMALYGSGDDKLTWSPYTTQEVQNNVMFNHNNHWSSNNYSGPWKFIVKFGGSDQIGWDRWQAAAPPLPYTGAAIPNGFGQDVGSVCTGCQAVVAPPSGGGSGGQSATPLIPNHLDPDTATLEASLGKWAGWFSANATKSADKAHAGTSSLKVDVTAPYGWGVQLSNYPGFAATAGTKTISFWGMNGSGSNNAVMTVHWKDASGTELQKDAITITGLSSTWKQATADVTAPAGTTTVHVDVSSSTGNTGDYLYLDDFYAGDRAGTTTADTTPPSTPTSLATTSVTSNKVDLSWTASTDNVAVTGYHVYRGGSEIGTSAVTTFSDTTATAGTAYTYTVKAYDAANNLSAASNSVAVTPPNPTDTTPPSAPSALIATAISSTQVNLKWTASTDNTGVTNHYVVRNGVTVTTLGSNATTYSDTGLNPSTKYDYFVLASDAAGNTSPASNIASVTTPALPDTTAPSTPSGLTATLANPKQVNLSWAASTDNTGVTGYRVFRNDKGLNAIATVTGTSFGDSTVAASTTYSYYVTAIDAAGNSSQLSNTVSITTPAPVTIGSISGVVSGTNGPLAGATVKLTFGGAGHSYSTNSNGAYTVTGIPAGTYNVTYSAKFYRSQAQTSTVTSGSNTTKNVTLQKR